jgi:hypothetical protein
MQLLAVDDAEMTFGLCKTLNKAWRPNSFTHPTRSNPNLLILILIARSLYRFNQRLETYMMQLSVSKIS